MCSQAALGRSSNLPKAGGHLPLGGVEMVATKSAPRKYRCCIDSSVPLAPEINFVFVWTVMGFSP